MKFSQIHYLNKVNDYLAYRYDAQRWSCKLRYTNCVELQQTNIFKLL